MGVQGSLPGEVFGKSSWEVSEGKPGRVPGEVASAFSSDPLASVGLTRT